MLKLRKAGHRELEKYYSAFEIDFEKDELMPRTAIHKAMLKGDQELLIIYDEETGLDYAYALVACRNVYGYVLLKYFGVLPWYRGHGLGVESMRLINKRYRDAQGIIAELTAFGDEDGSLIKKLRKFFARFGYVKLDSDYRIAGQEVELMLKPIKSDMDMSWAAHRIIRDFYDRCLSSKTYSQMIDIKAVKK